MLQQARRGGEGKESVGKRESKGGREGGNTTEGVSVAGRGGGVHVFLNILPPVIGFLTDEIPAAISSLSAFDIVRANLAITKIVPAQSVIDISTVKYNNFAHIAFPNN